MDPFPNFSRLKVNQVTAAAEYQPAQALTSREILSPDLSGFVPIHSILSPGFQPRVGHGDPFATLQEVCVKGDLHLTFNGCTSFTITRTYRADNFAVVSLLGGPEYRRGITGRDKTVNSANFVEFHKN